MLLHLLIFWTFSHTKKKNRGSQFNHQVPMLPLLKHYVSNQFHQLLEEPSTPTSNHQLF